MIYVCYYTEVSDPLGWKFCQINLWFLEYNKHSHNAEILEIIRDAYLSLPLVLSSMLEALTSWYKL